jgi:nucleoside-diphosphate-sugar epimerase
MKVLVTGCAGFIGWRVSQLLIQEGHTVVGIDNINDAYDVRLKQQRLEELRSQPRFTFYRLDISERARLEQLFTTHREGKFCDTIINLAARAGVRQSLDNPWGYYETNVTGTLNLLELSRAYEIQKFVLASTSSVYGSAHSRPFQEDANTDCPLSPYAASKKAAEVLCYTYHYLYGLDITVLRYFTVYGPAGRPDMSIFRFIKWIAEEEPIQLYGDGSQERDFTYVDDIARGTVKALRPLGYEIINLGSDHPVPLNQVIAILEELLGKKARIVYLPKHPADVPTTWADISKARKLLGWEPKTSLEAGLRQAVEWYLQNRGWAKEIDLL